MQHIRRKRNSPGQSRDSRHSNAETPIDGALDSETGSWIGYGTSRMRQCRGVWGVLLECSSRAEIFLLPLGEALESPALLSDETGTPAFDAAEEC